MPQSDRTYAVVIFHPTDHTIVRVVGPVTVEEGFAIAATTKLRVDVRPMWAPEDAAIPLLALEAL
jgi:hypothetical protein